MKKTLVFKKYSYLLFIIIFLGLFLRIQNTLLNSFAFTYDVGRDMLAIQEIATSFKIPLIGPTTGLPGLFYGPWWYYILTPVYIISGGNPQGINLFMALTGILTVIFFYILGKKISGQFLGILLAGMVSFSPFMIGISSQIWNPNIAPLILSIALLFIYRIINKTGNQFLNFLFLGSFLGLSVDAEVVYGLLLSLCFFVYLFPYFKFPSLKLFGAYLIGYIIIFSPRLLFELRHEFLMTNGMINYFLHHPSYAKSALLDKFVDRIIIFKDLWLDTLAGKNLLLGLLLLLITGWGIFLIKKSNDKNKKSFIKFSLISMAIYFIGFLFFNEDIWSHYYVGLPLFIILLFSIALDSFRNKFKKYNYLFIIFILFLFTIYTAPLKLLANFNTKQVGDPSVYASQMRVVDTIYREADGNNFNYILYTPPVHDYTYKYLFDWYGKNRYSYSPVVEKQKLFFVIIEPDNQYPQRINDWLKLREGDGIIQKEILFDSGIKVQVRNH